MLSDALSRSAALRVSRFGFPITGAVRESKTPPSDPLDQQPFKEIYKNRIRGTCRMQDEKGERWEMLCKLAAVEQDPEKLLELAAAIERLLSEKEERLRKLQETKQDGAA